MAAETTIHHVAKIGVHMGRIKDYDRIQVFAYDRDGKLMHELTLYGEDGKNIMILSVDCAGNIE